MGFKNESKETKEHNKKLLDMAEQAKEVLRREYLRAKAKARAKKKK